MPEKRLCRICGDDIAALNTSDAEAHVTAHLHELVDDAANQEDFVEDHLLRIHDAARSSSEAIRSELDWEKTAHVHDVPHRFDPEANKNEQVCHDCRRALINDAGTEPLLICPKLHGRRPPNLRPSKPLGAVECGQPGI